MGRRGAAIAALRVKRDRIVGRHLSSFILLTTCRLSAICSSGVPQHADSLLSRLSSSHHNTH
ncbi:hypothetical protein PPTG_24872 [Phytophthora nicotianae INRA-310]|uniref:Uncharacterized protein n=1 Tax=Phytophthora nicotianae (strain INRA-310) TaxID=761204 RepID=W2PAH6_PHYN3|nr:hypothetical protein PPTG_21718 [Phytophthora nicotianae INRA-310]XP_008917034.1 hypothetical protein PPTG_24872 [Phytophthora nicotianae INRA-310]ETM97670.1 hypothetical protein PPTG_24872 [Phytophthora nicotianae INRA-310]ETN17986.1 hypothetical protein PPTG_21718 [Phytophthora nicotianae INRA-310]